MSRKPLKRYGQHYLKDRNLIKKIIDSITIPSNMPVLEIGPGKGALTKHLAGKYENFTGIDIDPDNIAALREEFPTRELINDDILKTDFGELFSPGEKIFVIGNIPYNITSPLLFKLLANKGVISEALLMLQLEAANRILSGKGTKDYNVLNVLLAYYTATKKLFTIPEDVFYPPPNVTSVLVRIEFIQKPEEDIDYDLFRSVLQIAFSKRRKTLKNSMSNSIFEDYVISDKYSGKRCEELELTDFINLAKSIREFYEQKQK
jgi:16S rRNA (adenine1518-N6/adenine1519-N6)-dimethyltransferase